VNNARDNPLYLRRCLSAAVLLLMSGAGSPALAQTPGGILTLEQAISLALQDNRRLENAGMETGKAADNLDAERTRRLPELKLDASESYNLSPQSYEFPAGTFGLVPANNVNIDALDGFSTIVSASVKQPLSELYRIGLSIDQFEVNADIAEQQLRSRRMEIINEVKNAYFNILKTRNQLASIEESIAFYRELNSLVARYYAEQTVLKYETMEVESRLAHAEHDAVRERSRLATQHEKMNSLLGRGVGTPFTVSRESEAVMPVPSPAEAEDAALTMRPEVFDARLKLRHAEYGYRIEKSRYLPDIGLQYRYTRLYNTEFIPNEDSSIGLIARWEFYDWGRKSAELSKKNLAIHQARNEVADVESQVTIEVNHRLRDLQDAIALIGVTGISLEAAQEKLRVMLNRYRQQVVLLDDLLRAEEQLTNARTEHNDAQLSVWIAQADLLKAMGEE
jgi:outer membrane protein TolC